MSHHNECSITTNEERSRRFQRQTSTPLRISRQIEIIISKYLDRNSRIGPRTEFEQLEQWMHLQNWQMLRELTIASKDGVELQTAVLQHTAPSHQHALLFVHQYRHV